MTRFDQWAAANTGAWRDMDGWYGAQCWDLFCAYCVDLMGAQVWQCTTAQTGTWAGLAGSLYAQYPVTDWQGQHFERIPASRPGLKGDVILWDADAWHPVSHVAILLEDVAPGARPLVLAQNAGATMNARIMREIPASYGYLRPKDRSFITNNGGTMPTTSEIAAAVGSYRYAGNDTIYNYTHYASDNTSRILDWIRPRFLGAKDSSVRYLWWPGHKVIPLYEMDELAEIRNDVKNIFGEEPKTVLYNTRKQLEYAISILNNKTSQERKKLKP